MQPDIDEDLLAKISALTEGQRRHLDRFLEALLEGAQYVLNPDSDFATDEFCKVMGFILRQHHNGSDGPYSKDKFEYGLRDALNATGRNAEKAQNGKPGEDLIVDGVGWSCKTQADRGIKVNELYISKYMELGRGEWQTEADIAALRQRMFDHMKAYERIVSMRQLSRTASSDSTTYVYELVEIPKALLMKSHGKAIEIQHNSRQTPKPAYCRVHDEQTGRQLFELYFDGGTERKLQIKKLDKAHCIVHATWTFTVRS